MSCLTIDQSLCCNLFPNIWRTCYTKDCTGYMLSLFISRQYGFRKSRSLIHAAIDFVLRTSQALGERENTLISPRFFDTRNNDILLSKLDYYGVRGVAQKWFRSYLSDRHQYVHHDKYDTYVKLVIFGLPPGSISEPLLFVIYTNDVPLCVKHSSAIMLADDTLLFKSSSDNSSLYSIANDDLSNLCDWFRTNQLSLNVGKTHYMMIAKLPSPTHL